MVFIYVLELHNGKYYIGKTNNPQFRLNRHFNYFGSEWTKIYKPINVLELRPNCDDYDEDKITLQYMDKYGIDNVRGGSFVTVQLDKSTKETLKLMSKGTNNKCFICGMKGHFAKNCKTRIYNNDSYSDSDDSYSDLDDTDHDVNKCKMVVNIVGSIFAQCFNSLYKCIQTKKV